MLYSIQKLQKGGSRTNEHITNSERDTKEGDRIPSVFKRGIAKDPINHIRW